MKNSKLRFFYILNQITFDTIITDVCKDMGMLGGVWMNRAFWEGNLTVSLKTGCAPLLQKNIENNET